MVWILGEFIGEVWVVVDDMEGIGIVWLVGGMSKGVVFVVVWCLGVVFVFCLYIG